jgi:hypothetical protein
MSATLLEGNASIHDHTLISRKNRKIEFELTRRLDEIVSLVRREYEAGRIISPGYAKSILEAEVYDIFKSRIQQSYQLGIDYVTELFSKENYITREDVDIIDRLTLEYSNRFWGRIEVYLGSISDPNSEITNNFVVTSLAIDLTTRTLSTATISKTRQIQPRSISAMTGRYAVSGIKDIENRLSIAFLRGVGSIPPLVMRFQWLISLTDRTCKLCKSLNGLIFDIFDANIPTPGGIGRNHTHFNCRCRLIVVESSVDKALAAFTQTASWTTLFLGGQYAAPPTSEAEE